MLGTATGVPAVVVDQRLAPASPRVCSWSSRVRIKQCGFATTASAKLSSGRLDPPRRRTLRLTMARRLAGASGLFAVAAEQYLPWRR